MENTTNTTSAMRYTRTKEYRENGERFTIKVEITLADECKNGYENLHITADIHRIARNGRRVFWAGGCCNEEIAKHFPKLADFIKMHGSDHKGAPSYPVENGFYWVKQGKRENLARLLRCATEDEINEAMTMYDRDSLYFHFWLEARNFPQRWQAEADSAIAQLETLTGQKFKSEATRSHYTAPTDEEAKTYADRLASGYYEPEQCKERKEAEIDSLTAKWLGSYEEEIEEATRAKKLHAHLYAIFKQMSGTDVEKFKRLEYNSIIYTYNKEIAFNWHASTVEVTEEEIAKFVELQPNSSLLAEYKVKDAKGK